MKISAYVLTYNSERRLRDVLGALAQVADELVVVDSGSRDATLSICEAAGAKVFHRPFDDFASQRNFALSCCSHPWVLEMDSDEVMSEDLIRAIPRLAFDVDGYRIRRDWYALGRKVRCFYPSTCPDDPVRLYRKDKVRYEPAVRLIHEYPTGYASLGRIREPISHYTCDSVDEMYSKVNRYTTLLGAQARRESGRPPWWKVFVFPWLAWADWYLRKGGFRDGWVGAVHGRYVRDTVWQKYLKARVDP